jgi:diguanylate cyclase (GGDEF)-like protein/PAS domain S-box-containing protein
LPRDDPAARRLQARAVTYLFAAGATLALGAIAIHGPRGADEVGIVGAAGASYVVAAIVMLTGHRLGNRTYQALAAGGTALISLAMYFSGDGANPGSILYIWPAVYSFYFFTRAQAIAQVALAAASYAAVLAILQPQDPVVHWLITIGTIVVSGALIARLVEQVRKGAAEASRRAERLREAEERTRAILDTAQDAYIAMSAAGAVTAWNPKAEETFGWKRSDAMGKRLCDLIVPARYRPAYEEELERYLSTSESHFLNRRIELTVDNRDGHEFPAEVTITALPDGESVTFNAFVHDISARKRAETSMRDQAEDLTVVARVARELASVTDAHAARSAICTAAIDVAQSSIAILFEPDPRGRELVSTSVVGARAGQLRVPFTERSGAAVAFSSGQPFFVADLIGHPAVSQRIVEALQISSALWQPVVRDGVSTGVLAVGWAKRVDQVEERVSSLMGLLAAEAAVAIERADLLARLEAVARTDDLTGLANRRAWEEELPRELARARRDDRPVCVAMVDLDHFKEFNDEHGHQAGDRLLKEIASVWRDELRPTDVLARYGGEEFVLLLPNCPLDEAHEVIERLRSTIPAEETCSAGIATWDGRESPETLVSRADAALYRAKREGRNRSVTAS